VTESLPRCRVTTSGITEIDSDIPAFDTVRERYVINNQRVKRFKQQNTEQDEDCDKYDKQNENSVDPVKNTVSSTEYFRVLWTINYSSTKINSEM
jgi:hypothetical protein